MLCLSAPSRGSPPDPTRPPAPPRDELRHSPSAGRPSVTAWPRWREGRTKQGSPSLLGRHPSAWRGSATHIHHARERLTASVCTGPGRPLPPTLDLQNLCPASAHRSCPLAGPTWPCVGTRIQARPGWRGESTLDPGALHGPSSPAPALRPPLPTSAFSAQWDQLAPLDSFSVPEGELQPGQEPGKPRGTGLGVTVSHCPSSTAEFSVL